MSCETPAYPRDLTNKNGIMWRGNFPCCHGPNGGCQNHNPSGGTIFFDSTLPPTSKPSSLWKKGAPPPPAPLVGEICTNLPSNAPTIVDPLPFIHKSVPYTLAFYHIHAAMAAATGNMASSLPPPPAYSQHPGGAGPAAATVGPGPGPGSVATSPSAPLSALTCRGVGGSHPQIQWAIIPRIVFSPPLATKPGLGPSSPSSPSSPSFLLEYTLTFPISASIDWTEGGTGYAYRKNWLLLPGYRSFSPCGHMTRKFYSRTAEGKNGMRYARVEYGLSNVLGQEKQFRAEWRSEVGQQPVDMSCGMCRTDSRLSFELRGAVVATTLRVWRDLGHGTDPVEDVWVAALRGGSKTGLNLGRAHEDFGRVRDAFLGGAAAVAVAPPGVVGVGGSGGAKKAG